MTAQNNKTNDELVLDIGSIWWRVSDQIPMEVIRRQGGYYYLAYFHGSCSEVAHFPDWWPEGLTKTFAKTEKEAVAMKVKELRTIANMLEGCSNGQ